MQTQQQRVAALKNMVRRLAARIDALEAVEWTSEWTPPPRESGAVRRATMDLTRALADYRQGREIERDDGGDEVADAFAEVEHIDAENLRISRLLKALAREDRLAEATPVDDEDQ